MRTSLKALTVAVLFAAGCSSSPPPESSPVGRSSAALILDQAHNAGTPGFFFLPPLVRTTAYGETFRSGLSPVVRIDEQTPGGAAPAWKPIATFTTSSGPGGVTIKEGSDHYLVNWHTAEFALDPAITYRIRVLVSGLELGVADVDVVDSGKQLRNVDTDEYIPLLDDRTLPIKFRIEPEALRCLGVVCTTSDPCRVAGVCDPRSGTCTDAAKPDGEACDDGNACTRSDTCQGGACVGSDPLACDLPDACHDVGACDPATGLCSNPAKPDGTSCDDGDLCTETDRCLGGTCTGSDAVTCAASDPCHAAGTCDPLSGFCSSPAAPDGSSCDDGDACTQVDACEAGTCRGVMPVLCTAADGCHLAGTCDPASGRCSSPPAADGTACSDGNACTQADTCLAGACTGADPVVCPAADPCQEAAACVPASGACAESPKVDGTPCVLANAEASCVGGSCAIAQCAAGHADCDADPANGCEVSLEVRAHCGACGNACGAADACIEGRCQSPSREVRWTGAASRAWDDPANWIPAVVPGPRDHATVPAAALAPLVTSSASVASVILAGGTIEVARSGELAIAEAFTSVDGTLRNDGHVTLPSFDETAVWSGTITNTGVLSVASDRVVVGARVTLVEAGKLGPDDSVGSFTVRAGGLVTQQPRDVAGLAFRVRGPLVVEAGGRIDVTAKGYRGAYRDGNLSAEGETSAGLFGARSGGGGSYGVLASGATNPVYGSASAPAELGSGGGAYYDSHPGGNGGGRIAIQAASALVDGEILADGQVGSQYAGSGSGGAISLVIEGGSFGGSGVLRALGGAAAAFGSAGGGGRIAVAGFRARTPGVVTNAGTTYFAPEGALPELSLASNAPFTVGPSEQVTLAALTSAGGPITNAGTLVVTGTLLLEQVQLTSSGALTLPTFDEASVRGGTVTNTGVLVVTSDQVVVGAGVTLVEAGQLGPDDSVGTLTVRAGGLVTQQARDVAGLAIRVRGPLVVEAGGRIDVTAKGYRGAYRDGSASAQGETYAGLSGARSGGGGSYGGVGSGTTNPQYGSASAPAELGSGGGAYYASNPAGNGGGRIAIEAASAMVDGAILADGQVGSQYAGSGSGGAIWLVIDRGSFAGSGVLRALGGAAASYGSAGGGGRIAVTGSGADLFTGAADAGNGTLHRVIDPP